MGTVTDSADQTDRPRRGPGARISPIAVLGTLVLVAGAVLFGVHGPRMGQRGIRIQGIPATNLRDAILDQVLGDPDGDRDAVQIREIEAESGTVVESAIGQLGSVFGPAVEPPVLSDVGFELAGSRRLDLLGHAAVRLDYRSVERRRPAWIFELSDPLDFVHFDDRGRQQPLLPGTRIQETLHLGPRGDRGQFPSFTLVILATDGMATVIVALDPEDADEIAARIEPGGDSDPDSVDEVVATILEGPIGSMSRPGSPIFIPSIPT